MAVELKLGDQVLISPEESVRNYGFNVGRKVIITGMELTADKIRLLMKEAAIIVNNYAKTSPNEALALFNKFKNFCKTHKAEVNIEF